MGARLINKEFGLLLAAESLYDIYIQHIRTLYYINFVIDKIIIVLFYLLRVECNVITQ